MKWGCKLKFAFNYNTVAVSLFLLQFSFCLQSSFLCQHGKKSYEDIYHSPSHSSAITGNILIAIIRFARCHLLLASNSTFMNDSMYFGTIQICQNLKEHCYYLISTIFVIWQIDANCSPFQSLNMLPFHIRLERLKLVY